MTDTPTPHRATEDEWRNIEYMRQPIKIAPGFMAGGKEQGIASCIVELREALAALEQRVGALELHATTRTIRVSAEAFEAVTDLINGDSELHWGEAPAADPATDVDVFRALAKAEAALADIGDAEREPGDDLAWCERRAAEALPFVREALAFCSPPAAAAAPSPPAGSLVEVVAEALHDHAMSVNEAGDIPSFAADARAAIAAVAGRLRRQGDVRTYAGYIEAAAWLEREAGR